MRSLILTLALSGCIESNLKDNEDQAGTETGSPDVQGDDTGEVHGDDTGMDTGDPLVSDITAELSAPDGTVIDPKLSGDPSLGFAITADTDDCTLTVAIDNGIGQQVVHPIGRAHAAFNQPSR